MTQQHDYRLHAYLFPVNPDRFAEEAYRPGTLICIDRAQHKAIAPPGKISRLLSSQNRYAHFYLKRLPGSIVLNRLHFDHLPLPLPFSIEAEANLPPVDNEVILSLLCMHCNAESVEQALHQAIADAITSSLLDAWEHGRQDVLDWFEFAHHSHYQLKQVCIDKIHLSLGKVWPNIRLTLQIKPDRVWILSQQQATLNWQTEDARICIPFHVDFDAAMYAPPGVNDANTFWQQSCVPALQLRLPVQPAQQIMQEFGKFGLPLIRKNLESALQQVGYQLGQFTAAPALPLLKLANGLRLTPSFEVFAAPGCPLAIIQAEWEMRINDQALLMASFDWFIGERELRAKLLSALTPLWAQEFDSIPTALWQQQTRHQTDLPALAGTVNINIKQLALGTESAFGLQLHTHSSHKIEWCREIRILAAAALHPMTLCVSHERQVNGNTLTIHCQARLAALANEHPERWWQCVQRTMPSPSYSATTDLQLHVNAVIHHIENQITSLLTAARPPGQQSELDQVPEYVAENLVWQAQESIRRENGVIIVFEDLRWT